MASAETVRMKSAELISGSTLLVAFTDGTVAVFDVADLLAFVPERKLDSNTQQSED